MSARAVFYLILSVVLLADAVLLLLAPAIGLIFLCLVVLGVAVLIFFKPSLWYRIRPRLRKKQEKAEGGIKQSKKMALERCDNASEPPIVITHSPFEIGRSGDCDYVLYDMPSASRHHCRVVYREATNNYYIEDLNSTGGTFVNSSRIAPRSPVLLKSGSLISLDKYQFIFKPLEM